MPRKMRVQFPGAMYHVMSRGDQRDDIYLEDVTGTTPFKSLADACQKTDWHVHCVLPHAQHRKRPAAPGVARRPAASGQCSTNSGNMNENHKYMV